MSQNLKIEDLEGRNIQLVISADALFQFGKDIEQNIINSLSGKIDGVNSKNDDKLLTLDEAASFLKKSHVTLHNWKKKGLLPYIRISNKIYFKKSDLLSFDVINLKKD